MRKEKWKKKKKSTRQGFLIANTQSGRKKKETENCQIQKVDFKTWNNFSLTQRHYENACNKTNKLGTESHTENCEELFHKYDK